VAIVATAGIRWPTTDNLRPNHTDTTLFEKSCGVGVVYTTPHPHHNFFHNVWCGCGMVVVSVWFGRRLSFVGHRTPIFDHLYYYSYIYYYLLLLFFVFFLFFIQLQVVKTILYYR